jgi:hypothetical protein
MATDTMRRTAGSPGRTAPRTVPGRRPEPNNPKEPKNPKKPKNLKKPSNPRTRQVTAPRHTRPVTGPATLRRTRSPRMPFILLLVGLLGGALVSLLVISTTLAQGAFRITNLQEQNASLARQEQTLTNEVAQAGNPAVIAKQAEQLGMRPNPYLGFIDPKTGKIVTGKPSRAEAAINVPGYNP